MAPPKKSTKKEKLFHPQSRKAGQLMRVQHRKSKLADLARARLEKQKTHSDIHAFFYHAMPPEGVLSLDDLHAIIREVWLKRFDEELDEERRSRRAGRPKSTREQKLEDIKLRETELYRTGFEVVDLTDPPNVELFKRWNQKDAAFTKQLRFIRIFSEIPDWTVVSKPGNHPSLRKLEMQLPSVNMDQVMDLDEVPLLLEPPSRFASTMMTMDGVV